MSHTQRRLCVVAAVIGLHVAAVWALQSGLLRRAVEIVIPVQVLAEFIEAPIPQIEPEPQPPSAVPAPPAPRPRPAPPPPRPQPVAAPAPAPTPAEWAPPPAPPAPPEPSVAIAPPETAAPSAPPAPAAPTPAPAPPPVVLPSSSADYLNNPRPAYPPLSRRLGEQGKVVVRVFIETNGTASRAEVSRSSGYERLDQTALQTVLRWRYVPGKRAGVPQAMWFDVPIHFVLE